MQEGIKVTVRVVYDWLKNRVSKRSIENALKRHRDLGLRYSSSDVDVPGQE